MQLMANNVLHRSPRPVCQSRCSAQPTPRVRATNRSAADDDNMEEIDLDNVIGRRTRGKVIDFAKAAEENPVDDDEDEEDDDDFVEDDKMDED